VKIHPPPSSEVRQWRRATLLRAGVAPRLASRIADTPGIDFHELLGLVDRGCPPDLAVRIVAPLEQDEPA
jgi:hypothetical protein